MPSSGDASVGALERLPDALLGYWQTDWDVGNCTDRQSLLSFLPGNVAETIRIDENACYFEERGIFIDPATYTLEGRVLELTAAGSVRRFAVAVDRPLGTSTLHYNVFVPTSALGWQSSVSNERHDGDGLVARDSTVIALTFDAPVPLTGVGDGTVDLEYVVETFERGALEPTLAHSDRFAALSVHYSSGADGQELQIAALALDGAPEAIRLHLQAVIPLVGGGGSGALRLRRDPAAPDHLFSAALSYIGLDAPPAALRR